MKNIPKYNFYILFYFFILKIILCQIDECEFDKPIKKGNNCLSTFCTKLNFESGDCIISNSKVKTQWLNDIILVGESDFRYVTLKTSSHGELILATSSCPSNKDRIYYGIDSNGSPIFKGSNNKNIYIIKKTINRDSSIQRYESTFGFIKVNGNGDNNREYYIHIGKSKTYHELFDFSNNNLIEKEYNKIAEINIKSHYGSFINLIEDDKNCFILAVIDTNNKFVLLKLYLSYEDNGNIQCVKKKENSFDGNDNRVVSCYMNNDILVCAFFAQTAHYAIMILDLEFNKKLDKDLSISSQLSTSFHKLIHLNGNIGLFAYYKGIDNDYPSIQIIEAQKTGSSSYSIDIKGFFHIDEYYFENDVLLNCFIKINDNLVVLTGPKKEKEILIIVLISFYAQIEYNIRYYLINIFVYYNHKIMKDIALDIYNNNLVFAFSHCPQTSCNEDTDAHFSSLIFFSYPNSTDNDLDIINYLNQEKNNNLIINLSDYVNIDNNVFGYIFYGIKIYNIDNCGIDFISNITNESIQQYEILSKNEELELILTEEEYEISNCKLSFSLIITEPEYEEYNKYPSFILKENDANEKANYFVKNKYEGRIGFLNILINQGITKHCENNCTLCLKNNISTCILCKDGFNINDEKTCEENIKTSIIEEEKTTTFINEANNNTILINGCKMENIIKGICEIKELSNENFQILYSYIKNDLLGKDYNNENLIIETTKVIFQLSTLEQQKDSNSYVSSVDLKECEKILRDEYKIKNEDHLIILKTDIKSQDSLTAFVQYEIYDPYYYKQMNLSYCKHSEITINVPVNLDNETIYLYESLSKSGYNLFDSNDSFYNDICTPYTSDNKTDIILSDRKNIIIKFYVKMVVI